MKGNSKPKFLQLRELIRRDILAGVYQDGDPLPPESDLCAKHEVSRVTVRKALATLKEEGVVRGMRGSGTVVTFRRSGFQGALDMVVLVAPLYDPFFSTFFQHFEEAVAEQGTLVVFKQDTPTTTMASPDLYRPFIEKGFRDFVLWPRHGFGALDILPRLRGLGVNLVFFDHFVETAYADCVGLDNAHAIDTLFEDFRKQGRKRINFVGWSDVPLSSTFEREAAFQAHVNSKDQVFLLSRRLGPQRQADELVRTLQADNGIPDAFLALNAHIGEFLCRSLQSAGIKNVAVGAVDQLPSFPDLPTTCIVQPMEKMAQKVFECLRDQNSLAQRWTAGRYALRGKFERAD